MAAPLLDKLGAWTVDDLPAGGRRHELVDGSLVVSPLPTPRHEYVAERLRAALVSALGGGRIYAPLGITVAADNYRIPDVAVVRPGVDMWNVGAISPADVELTVEIVSPSSVTTDRITKPAQYAAWGIPAYWRVEIEPTLSLTAYVLRDGDEVYAEVGHWVEGDTVEVDEPFAVRFAIDDLRR